VPRRAAKPQDIRHSLYQVVSDLAQAAVWLPGSYAWEKERAVDALTRLSEDLARAAMTIRSFPGYPPDWPGYSHAAVTALAAAARHESDFPGWLAAMLTAVPDGRHLATVLSRVQAVPATGVPGESQ
jgi:hypothetical protein